MGEIWAIILAAGESKRMGFPKDALTSTDHNDRKCNQECTRFRC